MAVETDGSRFRAGAQGYAEARRVGAGCLRSRCPRCGPRSCRPSSKPLAALRALARRQRLYDLARLRPLIRFFTAHPAASHPRRQPHRSGHPARRHLLSEPVPRVADRCEARQPARAGRNHRRRHRRQRVGGDRPHRHRSRQAAGGRRRQEPVPRRRLCGPPAVARAGARDAHPAPPGAGDRHAGTRLCPGRHADRRHRADADAAIGAARGGSPRGEPGSYQGQERLDQVPGLADAGRPAGLQGDRLVQRHRLSRGADGPERLHHAHAARQRQGRADRVAGGADPVPQGGAGRAAAVDASRRDRRSAVGGAQRHHRAGAHGIRGDAARLVPARAHHSRPHAPAFGGGRERQPQHQGARRAAGARSSRRRGRPDGDGIPRDDGVALSPHRGERTVRPGCRPRAEEPAHRRALHGRSR